MGSVRRRTTRRAVLVALTCSLAVTTTLLIAVPAGAAGIYLHRGSSGANVQTLETRLHTLGLLSRAAVDRRYRYATWLAVRKFQRSHKLRVTGNTNTTTWNRVATAYHVAITPPHPPPPPPTWSAPGWAPPKVTAHRGGGAERPENTLDAFRNAVAVGADVVEFDLGRGATSLRHSQGSPWHVTLVETGERTQTGGRIRRIEPWVRGDDAFCLTYGDGLSDVDIAASIAHHRREGRAATVTAVSPPGRFGTLSVERGAVTRFVEKPATGGEPINGGFFVLSPKVFGYIADGDDTVWEQEPLQRLAADGQLAAFPHGGFWQPMDTLRDREHLEQLWASGAAPWAQVPSAR